MWVLESLSHVVVAGPFKSQAEMAKKLGLSQQYVNRQIRKCNFRFCLDGQQVIAHREKEFVGGGKRGSDKEELAMRLGVPEKAVGQVLAQNSSGLLQTPQGKVKIQKLKPGEKPPLPAVRVLWDDDTEKQDFVSFAAAARELKIDPKTISSAIKAGRDSFTRKSDGKKFTFEIPADNTPSRKKPKPPSEEQKQKWAEMKRENEIREEYRKHTLWGYQDVSIEEMDRRNKIRRAEVVENASAGPEEKPFQPPTPEGAAPPVPHTKVSSASVISEKPAAAPRPVRHIPWLAARQKASPEKEPFRQPTPPEVVEIRSAGQRFAFSTSKTLEATTFCSAEKLARYIKSGCGKLFVQGPKKHQTLICNEKLVFLPDLVKEIIVFHIRDKMWKDEDGPAESPFWEAAMAYNLLRPKIKDWIQVTFLRDVRKLEDEAIEKICKEFMKLV